MTANFLCLHGPANMIRQYRLYFRFFSEKHLFGTSLWDDHKLAARRAAMASEGTMTERLKRALHVGTREWWLEHNGASDSDPDQTGPSISP